jgi:hypothetical protein
MEYARPFHFIDRSFCTVESAATTISDLDYFKLAISQHSPRFTVLARYALARNAVVVVARWRRGSTRENAAAIGNAPRYGQGSLALLQRQGGVVQETAVYSSRVVGKG